MFSKIFYFYQIKKNTVNTIPIAYLYTHKRRLIGAEEAIMAHIRIYTMHRKMSESHNK